MMDLERLAAALGVTEVVGRAPVEIRDLAYDARTVTPGAVFFCVPGRQADGHDFAADAVERGAVALVVERPLEVDAPQVVVPDARAAMAVGADEFFARPTDELQVVGVTGTSGKSTVTAMVFDILRGAGREPSVITGGDLPELQAQGLPGNASAGSSDLLVVEADESDGSLVRYAPAIGVILNLQRDHKEMADVAAMFATLRARARETLVVGDAENLDAFAGGAIRFGLSARADVRGEEVELGPLSSRFRVEDTVFELPVPGAHNVANALGAIAACRAVGVTGPGWIACPRGTAP